MPVPELVFMAVPAFICHVTGKYNCAFFYEDEEYDPAQLIKIDLARNPNQTSWPNVQIDAHRTVSPRGLTSIGPDFPLGSYRGTAYLELRYYAACRSAGLLSNWPPKSDFDYQYMSLLRWGAPTHARFHGYHATVLTANGSVAQLAIDATQNEESRSEEPGTLVRTVQKTLWLDLADPLSCDPVDFGYTTITPVRGSTGAAFLSWTTIKTYGLSVPKLPPGDGSDELPK